MAFTPNHNIVGATSRNNELVAINDLVKKKIRGIQITNIHASAVATVDLYLFKDSTDTAVSETYYFLKNLQIPFRSTLILDDEDLLAFNSTQFSLYMFVGATDTLDVIIRVK